MLNHTNEEKRFDGGAIDLDPYGVSNAQAIAPELTPTILASEEFTDSELSGRLALDWQPSDALLAYVSYSRGFKSGGFDGSTFFSPAASEPFDSETLQAYELGAKLRLLDARALVSGAAFYYDYSDQQVQATVEIAEGVTEAVVVNAAQSEIYGLDIEASLRLTGPFRLDLGLSWLESEITEFASADPEEVAALTGNEVPNAPSFGYHIAASVEQPLGNRLSLDGLLGLSHVGDFFRDIGNRDALASDSYSLVSARLGITGTAGWSAYLWGENLTDEEYETYSRVPVGSLIVDQFGSPRTYGVGFSKVF